MNKNKWIFSVTFIVILSIVAIYTEMHRDEKMQYSSTAIGIVISVTDISGSKFSPTQVYCRYTANGESKVGKFGMGELKLVVGDCVMIRYSVSNPSYSEIVYQRGKVQCPN